jgi:hypothetical protein
MTDCCHDGEKKIIGAHLDEPATYIPLALGRLCRVCKTVCYTARPRQTKYGEHPLCGPSTYTDHLSPAAEADVLRLIATTFPVARIEVTRHAQR